MAKIKLKKITAVQKKVSLGLLAGLVVALGCIILWRELDRPDLSKGKNDEVSFPQQLGEVQVTATDFLESDDFEGGARYYDDQISLRDDEGEKKILLVLKSGFTIRAGRYDEAISIAKQADEMGSDVMTLQAIGDAYRAKGDIEQALIYYKRAQQINSSQVDEESDAPTVSRGPSIDDIIKELER